MIGHRKVSEYPLQRMTTASCIKIYLCRCGPEIDLQCMALIRKQDQAEWMRVLSRHRQELPDVLNQSKKQITFCIILFKYLKNIINI